MAETVSTAAKLPGKFQEYYNTLLSSLIGDSGYQEQSSAQMKNQLASALRPAYEQAKQQRALQTRANAARIDTDAAARGMGASTWVSDAKNRLQNAENADVAGINSNYISTLYQNLMDKLANQEANKLNVRQNAMNTALSATQGMYDKWLSEDSAGASGGGGGSGGSGSKPKPIDSTEYPLLSTTGQGAEKELNNLVRSGVNQSDLAAALRSYSKLKYAPAQQKTANRRMSGYMK